VSGENQFVVVILFKNDIIIMTWRGKYMLETVKGYYNGTQIVLDSPVKLRQGQEVVITYRVFKSNLRQTSKINLIKSLVGAIPYTGKSLDDYRKERLKKYESPN